MIPLPGANFVYSLVKDLWSWLRGRSPRAIFQSMAPHAKGWTVDRWYSPAEAAEKFGDQNYVGFFKEAHEEQYDWFNELMGTLQVTTDGVIEASECSPTFDKRFEDGQLKSHHPLIS
jgi:hypothetical protein